jgi:hypothetical protein
LISGSVKFGNPLDLCMYRFWSSDSSFSSSKNVPISPVMLVSFGKILTAPARRLIESQNRISMCLQVRCSTTLLGFPVGEQHANFFQAMVEENQRN